MGSLTAGWDSTRPGKAPHGAFGARRRGALELGPGGLPAASRRSALCSGDQAGCRAGHSRGARNAQRPQVASPPVRRRRAAPTSGRRRSTAQAPTPAAGHPPQGLRTSRSRCRRGPSPRPRPLADARAGAARPAGAGPRGSMPPPCLPALHTHDLHPPTKSTCKTHPPLQRRCGPARARRPAQPDPPLAAAHPRRLGGAAIPAARLLGLAGRRAPQPTRVHAAHA